MVLKKKFLIGGFIVFIAIGYLGYTGFMSSAAYYYTVSEFMSRQGSVSGQTVRLSGQVTPGSVVPEAGGSTLRFTITEEGSSLPVIYSGVIPDTFKAGSDVVIEGHLNSSGVFEAGTIMPKCASKYVSKN